MSALLDPQIILSIRQLNLVAKKTIDGFLSGIHQYIHKGSGMEFSQYRNYQAGDDLRQLDWKMFARSDRYYIREAEIENNIAVRVLLDGSNSMLHSDGALTKLEYAKYTAASLIYLAHLQGDDTGLFVFKEQELLQLPSKRDMQHLNRIFHHLEHLEPQGKFGQLSSYKEAFSPKNKKELMIFISDLHQENTEIFELLEACSKAGHEIMVLHLVAGNERALNYPGYQSFEDLETGEVIQVEPQQLKKAYQEAFTSYLSACKSKMQDLNIYYRVLYTDRAIEDTLRDFLKQRTKLKV